MKMRILWYRLLAIACAVSIAMLSGCNTPDMPAGVFQQTKQPVATSTWQQETDYPASGTNKAGLPDGKFIAILWASWCSTCVAEHHYLNTLAKQGIPLVGINYKDKKANAHAMLQQLGNPFQMVLDDPAGKQASTLGGNSTPTAFMFDSSHILRARIIGGINHRRWEKQGLGKWYAQLQ